MYRAFFLLLFIFLLSPILSHGAVVGKSGSLTNGLIGWWTFDGRDSVWTSTTAGTVRDRSGQTGTGTFTSMNSGFSQIEGKIGQAIRFDGINDRVELNSSIFPWSVNEARTASVWVKVQGPLDSTATDPNGAPVVFNFRANSTSNFNMYISKASTREGINFGYGTSIFMAKTSSDISASLENVWKHIVLVSDGVSTTTTAGYTLYVDGVVQSIVSGGGGWSIPANNHIGAEDTSSYSVFRGSIDDFRLYNRVLSANEVRALYNQSAGKFNASPKNLIKSGLTGHWNFDGKNMLNGVAGDISGRGNNGNIFNIASSTSYVAGIIGQGFRFDGVDDYIDTGKKLSSYMSASEGSMAAWAYLDQTPTRSCSNLGAHTIIQDGGGGCGYITLAAASGNTWCGGAYDTQNRPITTSAEVGKWTHLVWTHTGGQQYLYKDGVLANSGSLGNIATVGMTCSNIHLGKSYNGGYFPGIADDIRMYNRALTAAEVKALYSAGR